MTSVVLMIIQDAVKLVPISNTLGCGAVNKWLLIAVEEERKGEEK